MESDSNITEWIGLIVGGAIGVAVSAVGLVKAIPWRVVRLANIPAVNGQKVLQEGLRRDVDWLKNHFEEMGKDIVIIKVALASKADKK